MRLKPLYIVGSLYVVFAAALIAIRPFGAQPAALSHGATASPYPGSAGAWFRGMRPHCNPVEVETRHRWNPPPEGEQGLAYSAACYALAGKIDRAREQLMQVPESNRWRAVGIVFQVAHPVADAGDDLSAGPIMELVVEFWPNHYMALYHAGISSYELGQNEKAKRYLNDFLDNYDQRDGWRSNAIRVLGLLEDE